jgi:hypothetical protein
MYSQLFKALKALDEEIIHSKHDAWARLEVWDECMRRVMRR